MIIVTVGSQLPFDRLIKLVDEVAPTLNSPVFAQTGKGNYRPRNIESAAIVAPRKFDDLLGQASLVVSHAGIGTILSAQARSKPVLLFPRRVAFGEHRNDHQLATINGLRGQPGIYVAETDDELRSCLQSANLMSFPENGVAHPGREKLISTLQVHFANVASSPQSSIPRMIKDRMTRQRSSKRRN